MDEKTIVIRLGIAFLLGAIIGLERDLTNKTIGIKTHVMVSLGSALTMLFGIYMSEGSKLIDPTRISAQVVSGIGFLGALCVLKDRNNTILGLTTASSIWVMACIGIAVGGGFILGAITTTVFILINLIFFPKIKKIIKKSSIYKRSHEYSEE